MLINNSSYLALTQLLARSTPDKQTICTAQEDFFFNVLGLRTMIITWLLKVWSRDQQYKHQGIEMHHLHPHPNLQTTICIETRAWVIGPHIKI